MDSSSQPQACLGAPLTDALLRSAGHSWAPTPVGQGLIEECSHAGEWLRAPTFKSWLGFLVFDTGQVSQPIISLKKQESISQILEELTGSYYVLV